jgi:hypothetical protein
VSRKRTTIFEVHLGIGGLAIVAERAGDLLREAIVKAVDQVADTVGHVPEVEILPAPVAGIEDLPQVREDLDDLAVTGQWGVAQVVDRPALFVGLDDPARDLGERFLGLGSIAFRHDRCGFLSIRVVVGAEHRFKSLRTGFLI